MQDSKHGVHRTSLRVNMRTSEEPGWPLNMVASYTVHVARCQTEAQLAIHVASSVGSGLKSSAIKGNFARLACHAVAILTCNDKHPYEFYRDIL